MTQFNWTISAFDRKPENQIITNVHWRLSAERDGIFVETYGCTPLPEPTDTIIEYVNVDKEQTIIWLENILGVIPEPIEEVEQLSQLETIKQSLDKKIDEKLYPIIENITPIF